MIIDEYDKLISEADKEMLLQQAFASSSKEIIAKEADNNEIMTKEEADNIKLFEDYRKIDMKKYQGLTDSELSTLANANLERHRNNDNVVN